MLPRRLTADSVGGGSISQSAEFCKEMKKTCKPLVGMVSGGRILEGPVLLRYAQKNTPSDAFYFLNP